MLGLQVDEVGNQPARPISGAEVGENARFEFVQINAIGSSAPLAPGTYDNFEVDRRASALVISVASAGDVILNGIQFVSAPGVAVSNSGGMLRIQKEGTTGRVLLAHAAAGSSAANQFWTPRFLSYELTYGFEGVHALNQGTRWRLAARRIQPGEVSLTELDTAAEATVVGRALGTGTGARVNLTGTMLGEIARFGTTVIVSLSAGTYNNYEITQGTQCLIVFATGDVVFTGFQMVVSAGVPASNAGVMLRVHVEGGTGRIILKNQNGSSTATNQFVNPDSVDFVFTKTFDGVAMCNQASRWRLDERALVPSCVGRIASDLALPFTLYKAFAAGVTGAADDVQVLASADFAFRILRVEPIIETGVAASTGVLRTAIGGGGSPLSSTFDTSAHPNTPSAPPVAAGAWVKTTTVVASGGIYWRRSNDNIKGELIITALRT